MRKGGSLSRAGRRKYDALFQEDPYSANLWLLLMELADEDGNVLCGDDPAEELAPLMAIRFPNPLAYAIPPRSKTGHAKPRKRRRRRRRG